MNELDLKMVYVEIAILLLFIGVTASAQSQLQQVLPKVSEPKTIGLVYTKNASVGKISAADVNGKVQQWLEVWENELKSPNVVTYVLVGEGASFSATWGRGPIDLRAFRCRSSETPKFGDNTFWTATVTAGLVTFVEIKDNEIEGMFENLRRARSDYGTPEGLTLAKGSYASIVQQNIVTFMKEKNRKKWFKNGWLQPATTCINHF